MTKRLLCTAALATLLGCSSGGGGSPSGSGGNGSGGNSNGSGGNSNGSGGNSNGSGGSASGGAVGSGGHVASSGGSTGSGGSGTGGSGSGGAASGGATSSGGTTASGGATASGGTTASGGATSSGGGAGGQPGAGGMKGGGAGTGGPGGASGTPFFTADFESDTVGKQPAGWDNFISYNFNTTNPQGDGTGALVDSTRAHGGSKNSVHFKSTGNPVMIERALPSGTNRLYMRAYFYMTTQLGNGAQGENHETLLGLNQDPTSANNQVRFGMIKGAIGTNEVPTDNIAPKMASWYMPPVITANEWHCIEVAFLGDQTQNALYAWSDSTLVHSITAGDQWQNGTMPMNWLNGKFVDVMFGWQSFSSQANDVWMDDLVMSDGPIGCD